MVPSRLAKCTTSKPSWVAVGAGIVGGVELVTVGRAVVVWEGEEGPRHSYTMSAETTSTPCLRPIMFMYRPGVAVRFT